MPGSGNQTLGNGAALMFSDRADGVRRSGVLSKKKKLIYPKHLFRIE